VRGAGRGISKHRQFEQELRGTRKAAEAVSRADSDLLGNMSHELRTPLNSIIGFTELILERHFGDLTSLQEEYLGDVLQSARHLLSLINDIVDLSKVEAGKQELVISEVRLRDLVSRSLDIVKEKALKQGIRLITEMGQVPETILADEGKLKRVLYKLLSNALKFTPDGGEVRLQAEMADDFVCISVKDTGIGLRKGDLERVFQPFEQADGSQRCEHQGTGVGLALTRSLVELHGGKIWAESNGKGKGTAFRFVVPRVSRIDNPDGLSQEV
jgi:signal transduction histidine kinase